MKDRKHIWKAGAVCLATAIMLSGCNVKMVLSPGSKGEKEYGKAETMIILSTEKLRYENVYTEEIWNASVDPQGTTFEAVLLPQIHDFLIDLKTMSNMAKEQEITLTNREKELVAEAAAKYYMALGSVHAGAFEAEQSDVSAFYEDYWVAEKLVTQLTSDLNLEVSDSEAKVITVSQIVLADKETAERVLEQAKAENADFYAIAKEQSADPEIKIQIHRGMKGKAYENAAFSLAENEISDVFQEKGMYYILKCMDDYDEEATRIRKDQMMQEKKTEAFHTNYQAYKSEHPLVTDQELWETLSVADSPDVEADFFAIYEEVCRELY